MYNFSGYGATENDKFDLADGKNRVSGHNSQSIGNIDSAAAAVAVVGQHSSEFPQDRQQTRIVEMNGSLRNDCGKLYTAMYYFVTPVFRTNGFSIFYFRILNIECLFRFVCASLCGIFSSMGP